MQVQAIIAAAWLGMEAAKTSDPGAIISGFRISRQFFEGPLEEYKATAGAGFLPMMVF